MLANVLLRSTKRFPDVRKTIGMRKFAELMPDLEKV